MKKPLRKSNQVKKGRKFSDNDPRTLAAKNRIASIRRAYETKSKNSSNKKTSLFHHPDKKSLFALSSGKGNIKDSQGSATVLPAIQTGTHKPAIHRNLNQKSRKQKPHQLSQQVLPKLNQHPEREEENNQEHSSDVDEEGLEERDIPRDSN